MPARCAHTMAIPSRIANVLLSLPSELMMTRPSGQHAVDVEQNHANGGSAPVDLREDSVTPSPCARDRAGARHRWRVWSPSATTTDVILRCSSIVQCLRREGAGLDGRRIAGHHVGRPSAPACHPCAPSGGRKSPSVMMPSSSSRSFTTQVMPSPCATSRMTSRMLVSAVTTGQQVLAGMHQSFDTHELFAESSARMQVGEVFRTKSLASSSVMARASPMSELRWSTP